MTAAMTRYERNKIVMTQDIVSTCPACAGTGYADYAAVPCEQCEGSGSVTSTITIWDIRVATAWIVTLSVITAVVMTWLLRNLP